MTEQVFKVGDRVTITTATGHSGTGIITYVENWPVGQRNVEIRNERTGKVNWWKEQFDGGSIVAAPKE